jgi:hypothetical protein
MKVIAKKNTTKLVKGSEYEVLKLTNGPANRYYSIYVKIGKVRYFTTPNNFTMLDGSNLPKKDWVSAEYTNQTHEERNTSISDVRLLKKGDIVVCKYPTKYFEKDKFYKISDISYIEKQVKNYRGGLSTQVEQKIKIEGYNRWINRYRFRTCTAQEKREISLGGIFGDTPPIDTEYTTKRKIDRFDDVSKKKAILSCLMESILDETRHELSIVDWAVEKRGKKYDITIKDINPLLNKKLGDIIKELNDI